MKNLKMQSTNTSKKVKICCSTNPNLPLPQITNASDELVGKEVEINFDICPADGCNGTGTIATPFGEIECSFCDGTGVDERFCTVKPLKEISANEYRRKKG